MRDAPIKFGYPLAKSEAALKPGDLAIVKSLSITARVIQFIGLPAFHQRMAIVGVYPGAIVSIEGEYTHEKCPGYVVSLLASRSLRG